MSIDLVYDLDENPRSIRDIVIYSLQWIVTMFYGVVWGYAIVGVGLGFKGEILASYMSTVVLMIGSSTLIQSYLGHRFSMVSGPNDITSLAILYAFSVGGESFAFQAFTAQAIAGLLLAVFSYIGIVKYLSRIWSDLVSGSMVLMVGLAIAGQGAKLLISQGPGWPLIFSVILALFAGMISLKGKGLISTLPSLIIISLGYAVFIALGHFNWSLINEVPTFTIPNILPYGLEFPSLGLIVTMIIVNLMSILNVYGNLKGYSAAVLDREVDPKDVKSSFIVFSIIETALAGFLGVPGLVAYSESIGVITMTRVASRSFLIISSAIFILLGFLGPLGGFMAAMPEPVAGAILLGIASTVIGSGADIWARSKFARREIFIVGFSIFLSLGLSLQPDTFWDNIPRLVATVFSNPSITVIFSVIALEQIFFRK
ncbi:hypothetical protein GF319_04845 [Candidatus Bathyarchaeota archaeon]|nr:hypothetical protein [Candidatus Bathyarchaeota archaeon]